MQLLTIILIATGLSMDAFAVSVVSGSVYKQLKIKHAFRIALFFGGFQAIMPLVDGVIFAVYSAWEDSGDYAFSRLAGGDKRKRICRRL